MNTANTTATLNANRLLVISAILLAFIALFQLGLPERPAAAALPGHDVATNGDYTMLTLKTSSEDVLLVLDGRGETLSVYHVRNRAYFEPIGGAADLKGVFAEGRRMGAGRK